MATLKQALWIMLLALIAACSATPAQPTASPVPTSIAHNVDWQVVTQTFGGVQMVLVPPGCFMMGNNDGRRDERPANQICFQKAYWIDRTEVTNAQYGSVGHFSGPNRPRENLLWSEARDFCVKRGARLPTEAEWEYAARGPDSYIYPWGNALNDADLVFDRNAPGTTEDVGSKPGGVSWVGALDMAGNVFEWVSSIYKPYPYNTADGRENPNDTTSPRVYRGGNRSYLDFAAGATMRFHMDPDGRDWFVGFRCARDA